MSSPQLDVITLTEGAVFEQLKKARPHITLAVSRSRIERLSQWRSVCHLDGTPCRWMRSRDIFRSAPGERHPLCGHMMECVFQEYAEGTSLLTVANELG